MANNTTCDHLTNTTWPRPPYLTYSAITWLAPKNEAGFETLQKCCGGFAQPLQSYENDCLSWCETGDYWSKVLVCSESLDYPYHLSIGNTKGSYITNNQRALFMFPAEPEPPFAMAELGPPYTTCRQTRVLKIDYCVAEDDTDSLSESVEEKASSWLDDMVEHVRLSQLRAACEDEIEKRQRLLDEAKGWFRGWFGQNDTIIQQLSDMKMEGCRLLHEIENRMVRLPFVNQKSNWVGLVIFVVVCSRILGLW